MPGLIGAEAVPISGSQRAFRGALVELADDVLDLMRPRAREDEVWLADLGLAAKIRPVVIVSRHDPDPPHALVLFVL